MWFKYLLLFGALAAFHAGSSAADNSVLGERYAATCASCHGTNGVVVGNALPGLAGQSKDYIVSTMQQFKQGKRPATVMHQIAKGYSDEQIELLAAYFAAQKK